MMYALDEDLLARLKERALGPAPTDKDVGAGSHEPIPLPLIRTVEQRLEVHLPWALWQLYSEVGNGGFGPGHGAIGLIGGALSGLGNDAVTGYLTFRSPAANIPGWAWPKNLLPFVGWGRGEMTCVDLSTGAGALVRFHPDAFRGNWAETFTPESRGLAIWFARWLDGQDPADSSLSGVAALSY